MRIADLTVYDARTCQNDPAADAADAAYKLMLSVSIRGRNYRVSNETLDRLFGGDGWRRVDRALLERRIGAHHRVGRLVIQGQRLRLASPTEEAEGRLRSEDSRDEILRWGLLRIVSALARIADEIGALRAAVEFDSSAATERLTRDIPEGSMVQPSPKADQENLS